MKVAVITQYFPTSVQPWAGHSAYQTIRLLAQRCDLHVFYPQATYPSGLKPPSALSAELDPSWNPPGISVSYLPYLALPVVSRPVNGFVIARTLLPHVQRYQPDIILNYVVYPDGYAAVRIGRALKCPVALTAIGSDLNRMPDPMVGALTRSALRKADFVTTVSHHLAKTAVRLGARPTTVRAKLNGCDTSVFHPRDKAQARQTLGINATGEVVVYVGRLDVRKGLLELVEAIAALRSCHPAVHCYIVGDGPDKPLLIEAITRNNVAEAITLIPAQSTQQVALWMGAANLVTLPSYREGCPNAVIEGLAAGRPVVATNVGGIPELMTDRVGRLISAMDVPALTQALDEVLVQTWDADVISRSHGRSWADVAFDLEEILLQTLANSPFRPKRS